MKVLVTGARGQVGRTLLPILKAAGAEIRAVTRSAKGSEDRAAEWISLTISPETDWTNALQGIDCVIHLADGLRAFEKAKAAPLPNAEELIAGTVNLLRTAEAAKIKRFIYVSSIKAAAGETSAQTLDETMAPSPVGDYGCMKLKCEKALLQAMGSASAMELVIIRNPIVYGPGATNNMGRLLKLADTSWPLPFKGLANQRSIMSSHNLGDALTAAAKYDGNASGTYYVHDGEALSTGEIIGIFRKNLGRPNRLFSLPHLCWRALARFPVIGSSVLRLTGTLLVTDEKFRRHFDWSPPEPSAQALAKMAQIAKRSSLSN